MTIEEEIFRKTKIDFDNISEYGFKKYKSLYKYSKNIMDNPKYCVSNKERKVL